MKADLAALVRLPTDHIACYGSGSGSGSIQPHYHYHTINHVSRILLIYIPLCCALGVGILNIFTPSESLENNQEEVPQILRL